MDIYSVLDRHKKNITSLNILYVNNNDFPIFENHTQEYSAYPLFNFGRLPTLKNYEFLIDIMIVEIKNDLDIFDSKMQIQIYSSIQNIDSRLETIEYEQIPKKDQDFVLNIYHDFLHNLKVNEINEENTRLSSPISILTTYLKNEKFFRYIKEIISFKITEESNLSYQDTLNFIADNDFIYHYFKHNKDINTLFRLTNNKNEVKELIELNFSH